jgi:hypothetical protein
MRGFTGLSVILVTEGLLTTDCFKITVRTQQQCVNIILLWQHVSVLLDHLQASNQRYEVQSVHILYYGTPCYLQGVHKK